MIDPGERLQKGEEAARQGRYQEALDEYVWFHENALEHDDAYYGVRLSFALASWVLLANEYPPALTRLREVRDTKASLLRTGDGNREHFHDVEAINRRLGESLGTYQLFVDIESARPELASACSSIARAAMIAARDFLRARRYMTNPAALIEKWANGLNEDLQRTVGEPDEEFDMRSARKDAYITNYIQRITEVLTILVGNGERPEAKRLKQLAIESIRDRDARSRVQIALETAA